ncbi:hypothetical protein AAG906_001723 [Vitis piasezkii]
MPISSTFMPTTTTSRFGAFQQHPLVHRKTSPHSQSRASCVHVFYFNSDLNLAHIGKDLELFMQTKPGNLGKKYSHTVGVVDLGGETATEKAQEISDGEDTYAKEMYLK